MSCAPTGFSCCTEPVLRIDSDPAGRRWAVHDIHGHQVHHLLPDPRKPHRDVATLIDSEPLVEAHRARFLPAAVVCIALACSAVCLWCMAAHDVPGPSDEIAYTAILIGSMMWVRVLLRALRRRGNRP